MIVLLYSEGDRRVDASRTIQIPYGFFILLNTGIGLRGVACCIGRDIALTNPWLSEPDLPYITVHIILRHAYRQWGAHCIMCVSARIT